MALHKGTSPVPGRFPAIRRNEGLPMKSAAACVLAVLLAASTGAFAQDSRPVVPPQNGIKLSEIVAKIEQRDAFNYVSEIDWNEEGYYDVTYFTTDKAKVEIKIDAVTGQPR